MRLWIEGLIESTIDISKTTRKARSIKIRIKIEVNDVRIK